MTPTYKIGKSVRLLKSQARRVCIKPTCERWLVSSAQSGVRYTLCDLLDDGSAVSSGHPVHGTTRSASDGLQRSGGNGGGVGLSSHHCMSCRVTARRFWHQVAGAGQSSYREGVPQDLGRMIGNPAFEIARGVLMEVYRYSADEALTAIEEVVDRTSIAPEAVVDHLLADHTHTGVADLMGRHPDMPPR
jgi:hypothetical protein